MICYEEYLFNFFKKNFLNINIFLSQNLSKNICNCKNEQKNGLLFLVSGFGEVDYLDDKYLKKLTDNIKKSLKFLKTSKITLRLHPFVNYNKWVPDLQNCLKKEGIISEIDYAEEHISQVACKYIGVIGMPSMGLRDIIIMCGDKTKIVCFENLSKVRYPFPKGVLFQKEVMWLNDKNEISNINYTSASNNLNVQKINEIFKLIEKK